MKLLVILAAITLCGCATTVSQPGKSQLEADRDIQECKYEAMKASPENPLIALDIQSQCLKLRGYSLGRSRS
jgi:hypothetical protein